MKSQKFDIVFGGQKLQVEIGKLAQQANGAVTVRYGDTLILATAVINRQPRIGESFFPLMVDYEEKFYAAGKIKGSRFIKRETRPSDAAILTARLIDRTIRPRFNQKIRNDVQVIITVLSIDDQNDPDIMALLGASLALSISNIPWQGPIAGIRVGNTTTDKDKNEWILNPSYEIRAKSELDLVMAGDEHINMIEMEGNEIPEEKILEATRFANKQIKALIEFQKEIIEKIKPRKMEIPIPELDRNFVEEIQNFLNGRLEKALYEPEKTGKMEEVNELKEELLFYIQGKYEKPEKIQEASELFEQEIDLLIHENIIKKETRPGKSKLDEIREISCETGFLPRTHGSALFSRGATQSLSTLTLGAPGEEQYLDTMEFEGKQRFMHHYNFPPFSVGDVKPMRGPGRREIGHGALAEKALKCLLPEKEKFPYTVRVVSEILSSNGSSSMAAVCSSSLALMDAGVPIDKPAAGIAMGLMLEKSEKPVESRQYKILTDIQGPEDHHGDMDLKVAGTIKGITAMQMDVKIDGITPEILEKSLKQAQKARKTILEKMSAVLSKPRPQLSPFAPKILTLQINPEKIGEVIGPKGKVINEIIEKTGAEIDIEENGLIYITASTEEAAKKAISIIKNITREFKVGEIVEGKIVRILEFGAFVEIAPGQDGLIHISELAPHHIEKVSDVVKMGQKVKAKIIGIDELGRINLSLKRLKTL